ncbi:5-bromo-4-chloroindolyl phosphate hydrolysis family protein [Chryseomicrobium aureum]|uniref:5-bromo-4-chloroindolyl phosphate hydrolysis family protein n=1 Tax=Chryseomicrobium aureum TaxID=1441723 RepID=UPI00195B7B63|nr:5-bromo-4-chloroindolyl phosphate hydrolysis family protein [Chryseomicrobium aureum]MBM7705628.1 5-bromo-4-chloroindolyl phosphate hydrolysis protein [Chryseomicrobium aureum]
MNSKYTAYRHLLNVPISSASLLVLLIPFDAGLTLSAAIAAGTYAASNYSIKGIQRYHVVKKHGLTWSELQHISKQVEDAQAKIRELNQFYTRVRSFRSIKQLIEMNRAAKRVVQLVQEEPRRFYLVENFFYSHIDSALEITKKYALLVRQPSKDASTKVALMDARDMMDEINGLLQQDVNDVIKQDINRLQLELDYAKQLSNRLPEPKGDDKS